MDLIQCPECGKEISDKANSCPYCGNDLKTKQKKHKKDFYVISIVSAILSIFLFVLFLVLSENVSDMVVCILSFAHIVIFVIGILSLFKIITKRSEGRFCGGVCVLVSGFWVAIVIYTVISSFNTQPLQMTDEEKIAIGAELLGKQTSDNSIEVTPEFDEIADDMELFGYSGHLEHGYTSETSDKIDFMRWETNNACSNSDLKTIIDGLEELYGKYSKNNIAYEDIKKSYQWQNVEEYQWVVCGISNNSKIQIYWIVDLKNFEKSQIEEKEEIDEYGAEQMVGYNSLIALPEGSPVIVSGVANKISDGIYEIEIFEEDFEDVTSKNNWNEKTIQIYDFAQDIDYNKKHIEVSGHTDLSQNIPIVRAEKIIDDSEEYVRNGGILPK